MLCELRSLDHEDLRFRVITPGQFFDDYEPVLGDEDVNLLRLPSAEEALVLLVLKPGESLDSTTANLVAPIVVHPTNRRAPQVILDASRTPPHAPPAPWPRNHPPPGGAPSPPPDRAEPDRN